MNPDYFKYAARDFVLLELSFAVLLPKAGTLYIVLADKRDVDVNVEEDL